MQKCLMKFLVLLLLNSCVQAQENFKNCITFSKIFSKSTEAPSSVQETKDGGYIIAGQTFSTASGNVWLYKADKYGNKIYDKNFGGKNVDYAYSVQELGDGGFIIAGTTWSFGAGECDVWLIKTDRDGNRIWDKTFGGKGKEWGYCVRETRDGGFIIAAETRSFGANAWLIKTDKDGNKVWDKIFGGKRIDVARSVVETKDNGFIIAGHTQSFGVGSTDAWLIKTDREGNELWSKTYGGKKADAVDCVQQTQDDGFILAGVTWSFGAGHVDGWLIKTDKYGEKIWDRTFGGNDADVFTCVQETKDGGFITIGTTDSYGASSKGNLWLIKTNENGNKLWHKTFGGKVKEDGYFVQETKDGGFILVGCTQSFALPNPVPPLLCNISVWLIKTDENGKMENNEK